MKRIASPPAFLALAAAWAVALPAFAQTAPTPAPQASPDILPDVTVTARPTPDKADVIANRLPRAAICLGANLWTPDPTGKSNRAYYEELTGDATYYDAIRKPPRTFKPRNDAPPVHPGEMMFKSRGGDDSSMGVSPPLFTPTNYSVGDYFSMGKPDCTKRRNMEKDVTFARALAMYDKGEYEGAFALFTKAYPRLRTSSLGGETALIMARMHMKGQGTPRDVGQAIVWLERAAASPAGRGYMWRYDPKQPERFYSTRGEAAMALGLIHLSGNGVEKDPARARSWVELAMRNYEVQAQKAAADMYYAGYGGGVNLRNALMRYEASGEYNHAAAKQSAGAMYDAGEGGKADPVKALRLYMEAAGIGDPTAAYTLARIYEAGDRVAADPQTALTLYKIAALGRNVRAMTAIGTYFYEGDIVTRDHDAARAWFQEAAIRGEPDAMVNLAAMLIKGEGGGADPVRAWAWLSLAREEGREDVAAGIAGLEAGMKSEEIAAARALIDE